MSKDKNNNNLLNPQRPLFALFGSLCRNPSLLKNPEFNLSEMDFQLELHKIIFSSLNNIATSSIGLNKITEIDVDNYLSSYPTLYQLWEKYSGFQYLRDCINHTNEDTFNTNYEKVKKFSLLRFYQNMGIDVTDLYDYTATDIIDLDNGMKKIDSMTVIDIIEYYTIKILTVKNEFDTGKQIKDFVAGDGLDDLLTRINEFAEYGLPFKNGFYNRIFRGMRNGKFMLRSAGTGTGKTRQAVADVCFSSCDEWFDLDGDKWISNGERIPSLFISTELEKEEVQLIMLATVSGVNEDVIKDGSYDKKIEKRLSRAIEVIKRMPLYCVYIDDFSIIDIETIIEQYIIEKSIQIVAFDYIQITPKLARSMSKSFGLSLREDQILVQFTSALKILANRYGIFIISSTQLNRNSKDNEMRDTSSLRGGSALADKIDHGLITFNVTVKDITNIQHILDGGFGGKKPNYSHWVYKNRSGLNSCIIWSYMNLGNMREEPLFVTDLDYNLIEINQLKIDFKAEKEDEIQHQLENDKKLRTESLSF